jgi:hypothetical protein
MKKINKLNFNARSSKNIKISTFEKASKSSHFESDNQRQISFDLLRFCRYRMRLTSLISSQTFFEIMWSARCQYSKCMWWASWSKKSVEIISRSVEIISRNVEISKKMWIYHDFIFIIEFYESYDANNKRQTRDELVVMTRANDRKRDVFF